MLHLKGQYHYDTSASTIDGNGITPTPDHKALLLIQYRTGIIYRLDPATGMTRRVDLGGARFPKGDGLTTDGSRLYVPQNTNVLNVIQLNDRGDRGHLIKRIRNADFDVITNVAKSGDHLYLPETRLTIPNPRTASYTITSVPIP